MAWERRRVGLLLRTCASLGMVARDAWLDARGGGATPRWLLRAETVAFGGSALGGLAVLRSLAHPATVPQRTTLQAATTTVGFVAAMLHGLRLAIYLSRRTKG